MPATLSYHPVRGRVRSAAAFALALAALASAVPLAAQSFEGVVTMKLNQGEQLSTTWVKGKALRMAIQSGGNGLGGMVVTADGRMLMLASEQKQYYEIGNATALEAAVRQDTRPWKVEKLGRSETVAGHECEWYRLARGADEGTEMCVTQGLGDFESRDREGITAADLRVLRKHFPRGFFPLKTREPKSGRVVLEVTRVERRTVTAAEVGVPAGWTELKMPGRR